MAAGPVSIILIANNFPPVRGGSGIVYANLARFARGRILVVAPTVHYTDGLPLIGWREADRRANYPVVRLRLLRTTMESMQGLAGRLLFMVRDLLLRMRVTAALAVLLWRYRPKAVCLGELLASGWMIRLLALVPGLRIVVYIHGEEITTDDGYDPDFRRRRRGLKAAGRIVVVSRFTEEAVRALVGETVGGRIRRIENGVDVTRFTPGQREPELVSRYRLEGRFVFLSVCRLLEKKGVDQALRAFARLHAEHPETRYLIVGTGIYESELKALRRELGLEDAVIFAGNVLEHELVQHYRLGDVFVMPNRALANGDTEGFGLVFLEANACGVPVIAGRDGGSTDAVTDGVNGLVVDGRSVDAIYDAMRALHDDSALRERLVHQGFAAAAAADWRSRADTFVQICVGP